MVLKNIDNLVLVNKKENRLYIVKKSNFITNLKTMMTGKIYVKAEYAFIEEDGIMTCGVRLDTLEPITLKDIRDSFILSIEFKILCENNEVIRLINNGIVNNYKGYRDAWVLKKLVVC